MKKTNIFIIAFITIVIIAVIVGTSVYFATVPKLKGSYIPTLDESKFSSLPTKIYGLNEELNMLNDIPYNSYIKQENIPQTNVRNINEFGAGKDKSAIVNTMAIKNAMNYFNEVEGGLLYIGGGGFYEVGSFEIFSGTTLWIDFGTTLKCVDYESNVKDNLLENAFITINDSKNVEITGGGRIDGSGVSFTNDAKNSTPFTEMTAFSLKKRVLEARGRIRTAKDFRANLLEVSKSENVTIKNIEFYDSAAWTAVFKDSNKIFINDIIINNNIYVANSDGIDIVSTQDVFINNVFIVTGDDGICIKSNGDNEVKNINVSKASIMSLANCFKIGTETVKNISDVFVKDCYFFMSDVIGGYAGIAIESVDGAIINNVQIDNIDMYGITSPLLIWLGKRLNGEIKDVGKIENIKITNINADKTDLPIAIVGCKKGGKKNYVKNITLENFTIRYRDTQEKLNIMYPVPNWSMDGYPEITRVSHNYFISHLFSLYYDLPYYGIYARYVDTVSLKDINIKARTTNSRPHDNLHKILKKDNLINVTYVD